MKHPLKIERYNGTMEELARDIADLRYDVFISFFDKLGYELSKDQKKDFNAGRYQVSIKFAL
jgi:hypothetical protein